MDFAGPFVISGKGSWGMILLVVDKMTERVQLISGKQKDTAVDAARRFFEGIVRLYGIPATIVPERDPLGTKLAMSSANLPCRQLIIRRPTDRPKEISVPSRKC